MRYAWFAVLIGSLLLMISSVSFAAQSGGPLVRIKDMADVEGVRVYKQGRENWVAKE